MEFLKRNKFLIMFLVIVVIMIILAYWISQMLIGHIDEHMPGFGTLESVSRIESITHLFTTKSL